MIQYIYSFEDYKGINMEIIYYKSAICPKCIPTSRFLKELKSEHPEIEIKEIEIITHLKSTIKKQGLFHSGNRGKRETILQHAG
jgi:glutaredoxin